MATTVSTTIPADTSNLGYWEKTVTDMNDIDESFANARDLGYTRLNYARVSVVGKLSEHYDSVDMYKIQLQSNGTVSLSIKGGDSSNEKVLDLSAYEQKLDELKQITDPEGWAKEQEEKALAEEDALETQQPNPAVWEYNGVKERHPEDIVLYQMGDFFEIYGEDAKIAAPLLHLTLITRAVPSRGRVEMCGIPASQLEQAVEQLRAEHGVTISAIPEDGKERQEYTMVPLGIEQARMPTIRELHERYKG